MAVTKAQIAVWGLIAGLSAWGVTTLSRVKLPEDVLEPTPAARVVVTERAPRVVVPAQVEATPVAVLPATIPEFPFPDDLAANAPIEPEDARPEDVPALPAAVSFADIPADAILQISAFEDELAGLEEEIVAVAQAASAEVTASEPAVTAALADAPPIPMPARPMAARPVEAVPLAEVKTLYVVADMLNVRAVPSTTGPVLQRVAQGFAVAPRQQADEWIGFLMQDGTTGWMRTDYLSDTMPPAGPAPAPATAEAQGAEPINLMM